MIAGVGSRRPLPRAFYGRDTTLVARALLGTVLECETAAGRASGRIVETEAYLGPLDPASHSVAGLTARTRDLFGRPGTAYVYFVYGVHWCFNAVAHRLGAGTAVLVRAVEPIDGIRLIRQRRDRVPAVAIDETVDGDCVRPADRRDRELTNGPGKLCAALGIDGRLSGHPLNRPPLTIRRGEAIADRDVLVSPRIGLTRAADTVCRFFIRGNPFVSRTPARFPVTPYRAPRGRT